MPKKIFQLLLFGSLVYCFFSSHTHHVSANTAPQSATVSATATIPSLAVSIDEDAPTPPILIRPVDGSYIADNTPEFVWNQSTDPNGNTILYTLYLNGVATYLGISNLGNSAGNGYVASLDGVEVRLIPTSSLPDGEYSWYVTASDLSGNTSRSQTWHLVIDTHAPPLTLVDLDHYHLPDITSGSNFDVDGPKDVYFTLSSDPLVSILLTITPDNLPTYPYHLVGVTNVDGLLYLYQHLEPGVYQITITGTDRAHNETALPEFMLTIHQAQLIIPGIPGVTPSHVIPYTPYSLPSLPATISLISSRYSLASLIYLMLAVALLILLIILWKRRDNIILLDQQGRPLSNTVVYHSLPTTRTTQTGILATNREPLSYSLTHDMHGRIYIPRLNRYSTLTIRTQDALYILSLSAKRSLYTIILG